SSQVAGDCLRPRVRRRESRRMGVMGMSAQVSGAGRAAAAVVIVAALAGCGSQKVLEFENLGPGTAVIDTGDESMTVEEHGGVVILDYDCTPGDVTVLFEDGASTVVPGPVCSDQRVVIRDGDAKVHPARQPG